MKRLSIDEVRSLLSAAPPSELPSLIRTFEADERAGVRALAATARRRVERRVAEHRRLRALGAAEQLIRAGGVTIVAGIDEVGRGALAGPLTACAAVLPPDAIIEGLDDSKRLSPERREYLAVRIQEVATCWHVAHVSAGDIDSLGMTSALRRAMNLALAGLRPSAEHAIVDGLRLGLDVPETAVVGGDSRVAAVAAASILAKVARDSMMRELDDVHPGYGFAVNKGYGTSDHLAAIAERGITPLHRRSFAPCSDAPRLF